ncbi:hypothetical protein [Nostoc sp.]|uniref:hypothetical protein n=1 Tax=Nostoc sp. TaxID=1180 RepID=UPI002FF8C757
MDIEQVRLQYQRLDRHYQGALTKDSISFLDFSHTLRVWVDMKSLIDTLAQSQGIELELNNVVRKKEAQKILKGSKYVYLPLGSGVPSRGVEVRGVRIINRALNPEEIKKLYEAGLPEVQKAKLTFSQWLASGIYDVPSENEKHPKFTISREILIKRVANILGASHPHGTDNSDATENRFDPYVIDLHQLILADGYPATYYQLLEIGKDILQAIKLFM